MINFIKQLIGVFLLVLIQFTLLDYLFLSRYVDLLLIALFFWSLSKNPKQVYFLAFFGGIFYDLFSNYPLGSKTFLYLSFSFVLILICQNFLRNLKLKSSFLLVLLSFSFFELVKVIFFIAIDIPLAFNVLILERCLINSLLAMFIILATYKK
ncbi:rod shape-determining protein MreD [bacterium]|nr:MAG: rod shape-determining protein MreD [bacterium]